MFYIKIKRESIIIGQRGREGGREGGGREEGRREGGGEREGENGRWKW